jgi:hypothetical protein
VKRLIALLTLGVALAALLPVSSGAVDTRGPACADIVFGDGSYAVNDLSTAPPTPLAEPTLTWRFDLAAPSCAAVTYTLYIYDSTGTTLLGDPLTVTGVSGASSIEFTQTFNGAGEPTADPDGVCLVGTTSLGRHVADRAPDEGCVPVAPDSGGGVGFQ